MRLKSGGFQCGFGLACLCPLTCGIISTSATTWQHSADYITTPVWREGCLHKHIPIHMDIGIHTSCCKLICNQSINIIFLILFFGSIQFVFCWIYTIKHRLLFKVQILYQWLLIFSHNLLILTSFQTCMDFFLLWNPKVNFFFSFFFLMVCLFNTMIVNEDVITLSKSKIRMVRMSFVWGTVIFYWMLYRTPCVHHYVWERHWNRFWEDRISKNLAKTRLKSFRLVN